MVHIEIPEDAIKEFCQRWGIRELALFGSVVSENFTDESDIDVLITLPKPHGLTLFDHMHMQEELSEIFGRKVDLMTRAALERSSSPTLKKIILKSHRTVYAAP